MSAKKIWSAVTRVAALTPRSSQSGNWRCRTPDWCVAGLLALLLFCGIAHGQPSVVLLPPDNISGAAEAPESVMSALAARVERAGWRVVHDEKIDEILERNRVRYLDSVTDAVRNELTSATGASALIVTSICSYRGGDAAVVTLAARMISADGTLLWSDAGNARAEQTEHLLGGAKRTGPVDVTNEAVAVLTREFPAPSNGARLSVPGGKWLGRAPVSYVARDLIADRKPRICVLPFDSNSEVPEAARVVANALALRIAAAGNFEVVEPAELRAAAVKARIGSFRALASEELAVLARTVGTPLFLRGAISRYVDTSARNPNGVPEVELELFLVDVVAGNVLWTASHARSGSEYVGFLMLGGVTDAVTLADRVVCEITLAAQKAVRRNTAWAAAHPNARKPEKRQLLATRD